MKNYSVAALYYVDGVVTDNDYWEDFDTLQEAERRFSEIDPKQIFSDEELSNEGAYVTINLEDHTGKDTDVLNSKDFYL